jgi:hypothetical protein
MSHAFRCLTFAIAAFAIGGCNWGTRAADRTVQIYQFQSVDTYPGPFVIDTSRLPPDAIETRIDTGVSGAPVTQMTINMKYPVRIVLVPVTQP